MQEIIRGITRPRAAAFAIALGFVGFAALEVSADEIPRQKEQNDAIVFFESKVRPILVNRCGECHC